MHGQISCKAGQQSGSTSRVSAASFSKQSIDNSRGSHSVRAKADLAILRKETSIASKHANNAVQPKICAGIGH